MLTFIKTSETNEHRLDTMLQIVKQHMFLVDWFVT